jgi:hypothetical protein
MVYRLRGSGVSSREEMNGIIREYRSKARPYSSCCSHGNDIDKKQIDLLTSSRRNPEKYQRTEQ